VKPTCFNKFPAPWRCGASGPKLSWSLTVANKPFVVALEVPRVKLHLEDIVPIARKLADRLMVASIRASGCKIACKRKCDACCHYLVPLSAPEAMELWHNMCQLPDEKRKGFLEACVSASRKVLDNHDSMPQSLSELSKWYSALHLPCPLLLHRLCGVYSFRPISCREHVVAAGNRCRIDGISAKGLIRPPYRVGEALAQLSAEFQPSWPKAIMLPLGPAWATEASAAPRRRFPAEELLDRLFEALQAQREQQVAKTACA
jgi:hypothetical protein